MGEQREELFRQHHASIEKLSYFLLASAGTSIGFAITLQDVIFLMWPDLLLIASICIWSISFWSGTRVILSRRRLIYLNDMYLVELENSPPHAQEFVRKTVKDIAFDPMQMKISRWSKLQMLSLVLGAIILLCWRIASAYPDFDPLSTYVLAH